MKSLIVNVSNADGRGHILINGTSLYALEKKVVVQNLNAKNAAHLGLCHTMISLTSSTASTSGRMAKQVVFSINDAVRIAFSAVGVWVFVHYGADTKEACDSTLFGVKTNAVQILGALLIILGLGAPMLMKWLANRKAADK